ncbi:MAG: M3 family oligoendopeptidase [Anaerolineales bacterium]|nr:M3 family oligoendopeptidase [Anaerolineales bacterium]
MTYELGKWDLSDLFPAFDSPEMESAFETLKKDVAEFEKFREKLSPDMDVEEFMSAVESQEKTTRLASRVGQFAGLFFSEDTQNQDAQTFQAKMQQFMAGLQNRTLFFSLWWKSLEEDETQRFMEVAGEYDYWLKQIRNFKPYTLTEPEEKIINIKDVTGISAMRTLYSSITNRYVFKVEVDGEEKEMTRGELMTLVRESDPDLRARAYQELYQVYGDDGAILGQMYQAIVRDYRNENLELRGFDSPMAVRNLDNDIPNEVVDTLLDVAVKNTELFQRFFRLKAKWLKVDRLRRYDIYAPVAESDKEYTYDKAVSMVLDSFNDFSPKVAELAKRVFEENHLDSSVRKGKRSGAFCSSGDPAVTPYVLVNYNGKANDVSTLAHELGHAIHAMLAEKHHVFHFHSSLPLAETASTFSEMLLIDLLLEEEADEAVRRDILFSQIDDAYATIMRQIFFALFEREAHEMVAKDASVDELAAAYLKNLETQFGDSVSIGEEFRWEWVSIPHIYHWPFYVYAYSFGQLLVLALYQQYKQEGEPFIPRYLEILAAGGSMAPVEILDRAGVDVRKPEFWQGGFDVLSRMVDDLEKIPVE